MRDIKFRVWNGECMVSPDYIDREGAAHWYENSIPQINNRIMQYTGLKDKNGKEIYEGDIILDSPPFQAVRCTVEFIAGSFMALHNKKARFITPEVEVIGNIYERRKDSRA